VATDSDIIGATSELAYEIGFREHIYNYAIVQKFTDQGISADEYTDRRVSPWVSKKEILERALLKMKYGLKSSYYQNSLVNSKQAKEESADQPVPELETAGADERGCGSGGCTL
jgi:ribonucleoside-diphosphate reductase alpha chain